jgi:hypothetical protein
MEDAIFRVDIALSRRERGRVGMREGNTYAHARTM